VFVTSKLFLASCFEPERCRVGPWVAGQQLRGALERVRLFPPGLFTTGCYQDSFAPPALFQYLMRDMIRRSKNKKSDDHRQLTLPFGEIPKVTLGNGGDRPFKPANISPEDMDDGFSLSPRSSYVFDRE
jgi:hypothetical protein